MKQLIGKTIRSIEYNDTDDGSFIAIGFEGDETLIGAVISAEGTKMKVHTYNNEQSKES